MDEREVANCDLTWWHGGWKYPFLAFAKHANPSVSPRFDFTIEYIRAIYPKILFLTTGQGIELLAMQTDEVLRGILKQLGFRA